MQKQAWKINSTEKDEYQYQYDCMSNRTHRKNVRHTAFGEQYAYDELNRLKQFQRGTISQALPDFAIAGQSRTEAFKLDPVGNWTEYDVDTDGDGSGWELEQARAHNVANAIDTVHGDNDDAITIQPGGAGSNWQDPVYDAAGNMISGPRPGAESTGTARQFYTYDAWNRLASVWRDKDDDDTNDTTEPADEHLADYTYDGLHRRIRKVLRPGTDVTYDYYNAAWQVLEVRKESDPDPLKQYAWGARYIDSPVVRWRDTNQDETLEDTVYYCNDANMNVTALVAQLDRTTKWDVVERYLYEGPYGTPTVLHGVEDAAGADTSANEWNGRGTTDTFDNEILFAGYRYDPETALYHVRNRYYDPALGRWTVCDFEGYIDGMNLYQNARSAPARFTDPSGLVPTPNKKFIGDVGGFEARVVGWFFWHLAKLQAQAAAPLGWKMRMLQRMGILGDMDTYYRDKTFVGLYTMAKVFDPGHQDDGTNMFFYTCRGGWIDSGHFFKNAAIARALTVRRGRLARPARVRNTVFELSKFVERDQLVRGLARRGTNAVRTRLGRKPLLNGWGYSAYTIEDLPSNWYGAGFGANSPSLGQVDSAEDLGERAYYRDVFAAADAAVRMLPPYIGRLFDDPVAAGDQYAQSLIWGSVRDAIKDRFVAFLESKGVVALRYRTSTGESAATVLLRDATGFTLSTSETSHLTWRAGDPKRPWAWNFSKQWQKTPSHWCLCTAGVPIDTTK